MSTPASETTAYPAPYRIARLFRNGRNQALRIPREFELVADEVAIYREGDRLVIQPVARKPSLADILATLEPIEEGFPDVDDPPVRPEQPL